LELSEKKKGKDSLRQHKKKGGRVYWDLGGEKIPHGGTLPEKKRSRHPTPVGWEEGGGRYSSYGSHRKKKRGERRTITKKKMLL